MSPQPGHRFGPQPKRQRSRVLDPNALGMNVERERQAANLTYKELGMMAGLAASAISELASGAAKNPRVETVYALATTLGVRMEDLMGVPRVEATTKYRSRARSRGVNGE